MTYVREVTKLTIITLAYIIFICSIGLHGAVDVFVDFEPMCPGFESRFFFFDFFFIYLFFYFFLLLLVQCQFANSAL